VQHKGGGVTSVQHKKSGLGKSVQHKVVWLCIEVDHMDICYTRLIDLELWHE